KTVLDLEALANHRGSTFGALGLPPQPSQKDFEAGLWMSLKDLKANQVFMEAESRRIGKLSIPTFLFKRMKVGRKILIESPFTLRLKRLLKDYTTGLDKDAVNTLITRSESIRQTMGNVGSANLIELLEKDDLNEFVEVLLHKYYDPLYLKHLKKAGPFELNLTNQDPAQTAEKIADYISSSSAVSSRPTLTDKLKIQQS
ncbi:MAG: hypothetical protein K8F91_22565, partial [Candidatus Obscuribacterales bacterium]|nr:hypothetical protein [Candidatus Obscuribacterales bacterium]